jgi:hypothetical protein
MPRADQMQQSPARPSATSGCRGSGPDPSRDCPYRVRRGFPRLLCTLGSRATHAETLRALPRTTQRLLWAGHSLSGYQEAHQQAQKKATKIAKAA